MQQFIEEKGDIIKWGVISRYSYANERLVSVNDRSDTPIFHFDYNGDNRIAQVRDNHERLVGYSWKGGNLVSVTDVLGHVQTYRYSPAIRYVYPSEVANLWVDSYVIPKTARNIKNAHKFINFMMKPEVAKVCVEENGYSTPMTTALPLLDENVRNSLTVFPTAEIMNKGGFQTDVGEALPIYRQYWEKLRTGN